MRSVVIFILNLIVILNLISQNKQLTFGFGNFEGFNTGFQKYTEKLNYGFGLGTDMNIYDQGYMFCAYGSVGKPLLKRWSWTNERLNFRFKTSIWNIENPSNVFSAVSLIPELHYDFLLLDRVQMSIYSGIGWSSVFRYRRKSFFEIGWPKEWLPQFGVQLKYGL